MATQYSVGHGMRRRSGIAPNYLEAAGKSMARKHMTSDEAFASAQQGGSARIPMGMDAYSVTATPALTGTPVPKKNVQAGDPTNPGSKANRVNMENIGASYRVTAAFTPTIDPAAGPTMRSARIVPSVAGRSAAFGSEAASSIL